MNRSVLLLIVALVGYAGCDTAEHTGADPAASLSAPLRTTRTASNASSGQDVGLAPMCRGWWRVDNLTGEPQSFSWEHVQTGVTGTGAVPADGMAFFQAPHADASPNTVVLFDGNEQQDDARAASDAACPTVSGSVSTVPDGVASADEGAGIAGVRVEVFFAPTGPAPGEPAGSATTQPDGSYSVDLPAHSLAGAPFADYVVTVPETADGAFNVDLFAYFDPVTPVERSVRVAGVSVSGIDFAFDGDDDAFSALLEEANESGARDPWRRGELRRAFDRARNDLPCEEEVLCRGDLLALTRAIVDDPDDPDDPFFGAPIPYLGPDTAPDGQPYTDDELLEWGYQTLTEAPPGTPPLPPDVDLYGLVFACQINHLGGRGLPNVALDRALQIYFETSVRRYVSADGPLSGPVPRQLGAPRSRNLLPQLVGGGGGGVVDAALRYVGGGGGGTVDE